MDVPSSPICKRKQKLKAVCSYAPQPNWWHTHSEYHEQKINEKYTREASQANNSTPKNVLNVRPV